MQRITIERLGSGVLARLFGLRPPAGVVRLRVWFEKEEDVPATVSEILQALSRAGTVSLEFWDASKSVRETLGALSLTPSRPGGTAHLTLLDIPVSDLGPILDRLSFASFGGWIGIESDTLSKILKLEKDRDRMRAMPDGGLMIVFSLYDRNIELVAKGLGEDVLKDKIQTVARRTGAEIG